MAIVGNDISNLPAGVDIVGNGSAEFFDLIANNSIHAVSIGIEASGIPVGSPSVSWCTGNVFRDNDINGPEAIPNLVATAVDAGIAIGGSSTGGASPDMAVALMNVFDQNDVAGFNVGMEVIDYAKSYNPAGGDIYGGIVDSVLANDFFASSGGMVNNFGLTTTDPAWQEGGIPNFDSQPYFLLPGTDTWQDFWNLTD